MSNMNESFLHKQELSTQLKEQEHCPIVFFPILCTSLLFMIIYCRYKLCYKSYHITDTHHKDYFLVYL